MSNNPLTSKINDLEEQLRLSRLLQKDINAVINIYERELTRLKYGKIKLTAEDYADIAYYEEELAPLKERLLANFNKIIELEYNLKLLNQSEKQFGTEG